MTSDRKVTDHSIFVSDAGFQPLNSEYLNLQCLDSEYLKPECRALVLAGDDDPFDSRINLEAVEIIRIDFASSHDGRGFSLARALRARGYLGCLVAGGGIIVDQYRHLRQCGFDGVVLTAAQADRMPEPHWREQVPRISRSYQGRVFGQMSDVI